MESRARPGQATQQPYENHALSLVEAALEALKTARHHVSEGRLDSAVGALDSIKAAGPAGLTSPADCQAMAVCIEVMRADVRAAVVDGFAAAWRGSVAEDTGQRLALEIAALCIMEGRQHY